MKRDRLEDDNKFSSIDTNEPVVIAGNYDDHHVAKRVKYIK